MCISAYLILNDGIEKTAFKVILAFLVCFAPLWRWSLQGNKEVIGGPWEIAHVDSTTSS